MATIMGKSGYIIVGMGTTPTATLSVDCIDSWNLTGAGDAIETTQFGTTSAVIFKTYEAGLKSLTGNAAGNMDGTLSVMSTILNVLFNSAANSVVNATLYMDAGHHVSVGCIITGFTVNTNVADKVTFGFDFTVSGQPVYV